MKNFDTRAYSIADFFEWHKNELLELSPDFQRREVWSEKAKSYLIDSIIRGRPIPKILISQRLEGTRTTRVVVDGQQRLRAVLEFINGDFAISKAHHKELAGKRYATMSLQQQKDFLQYELGVDVLFDLTYQDLLDIFARINSYTIILNKQEKLNAQYLGYFKQAAYELGLKYVDYFLRAKVLTKEKVTRMTEAALTGDMLMSLIGGVQTNKSLEQFYKKYEDKQGPLERTKQQFDTTMSYIGEIYPPEEIQGTNWSRIHLFYTLFTSIAHCLYGLGGVKKSLRSKLSRKMIGKLRVCLDDISATYDKVAEDIDNPDAPKDYKNFIMRSRRATTDTMSRIKRAEFVCRKIRASLGQHLL
jgi:hypothetical protein